MAQLQTTKKRLPNNFNVSAKTEMPISSPSKPGVSLLPEEMMGDQMTSVFSDIF
jgi:hypothetical protein